MPSKGTRPPWVWWFPTEGRYWIQDNSNPVEDARVLEAQRDAVQVTNARVVVDDDTGLRFVMIGEWKDFETVLE